MRLLLLLIWALNDAAFGAEISYCGGQHRIDGELDDWRAPWYAAAFAETAAAPAQANQVSVQICWTLEALHYGIRVEDQDLLPAPTPLAVDQYHQYDSVQIYIDARGDDQDRMNDDDVDILLLPDGRAGVLRGDALVGALAAAIVPQRESTPLPLRYASQRWDTGWQLELAVPFAGLGIEPRTALPLRMDVAINDWLVDHPPGASEALTPERVRALAERSALTADTNPAVGTQLWPRNWSGDNDFGYPQRWRSLTLTGAPGVWEGLVRRLGAGTALGLVAALCLALAGLLMLGLYGWHRRQLQALLARLAELPTVVPASAPAAASAPAEDVPASADAPDVSLRDREFAERVLGYVRAHLELAHSPSELAEHFHVSLRTLQRRVRSGLGSSPQDLVLAARLESARELLQRGSLRVSEVAARVGFEDLSHFSRRYRLAFGHAPSAERTERGAA